MLKHLISACAKQRSLAKLRVCVQTPFSLHGHTQAHSFSAVNAKSRTSGSVQGVDRSQFSYSAQIPDFEVGPARATAAGVEVTDEMAKKKHPLEYLAEHSRKHEDPFTSMNDRSVMLLNFPRELQVTEQYVRDLCGQADPEAVIERVRIRDAMRGNPKKPYS